MRLLLCIGLLFAFLPACSAPISTTPSPQHRRIVEIRNASSEVRTLAIEPTADEALGAATTFLGRLAAGEAKVLYLYHGLDYRFRILGPNRQDELTTSIHRVDHDMGFVYVGDSLTLDTRLGVELGDPEATFADSLQYKDPFGIRSGGPIEPDTTSTPDRGQRLSRARRGQLP